MSGKIKVTKVQRAYLRGEVYLSKKIKWTEEYLRAFIEETIAEHGEDLQALRRKKRRAHVMLYTKYPHLLDEYYPNRVKPAQKTEQHPEWTLEYCVERVKLYPTWKQFMKEEHDMFLFVRRSGMIPEINKALGRRAKFGYHEARALLRASTDYDEFVEKYPNVYEYILSVPTLKRTLYQHFSGILRERKHTDESIRIWQEGQSGYRATSGDDIYRCIYVCLFEQTRVAYIGLTCDPARRKKEHGQISRVGSSAVARYKWTNGLDFDFKVITDFMPEAEAKIAEGQWEQKYKDDGWTVINIAPCGSLGGSGMLENYWVEVVDKELKPVPADRSCAVEGDFDRNSVNCMLSFSDEMKEIIARLNCLEVGRKYLANEPYLSFYHFDKPHPFVYVERVMIPALQQISEHLRSITVDSEYLFVNDDKRFTREQIQPIRDIFNARFLRKYIGVADLQVYANKLKIEYDSDYFTFEELEHMNEACIETANMIDSIVGQLKEVIAM